MTAACFSYMAYHVLVARQGSERVSERHLIDLFIMQSAKIPRLRRKNPNEPEHVRESRRLQAQPEPVDPPLRSPSDASSLHSCSTEPSRFSLAVPHQSHVKKSLSWKRTCQSGEIEIHELGCSSCPVPCISSSGTTHIVPVVYPPTELLGQSSWRRHPT
jgi:hypothetical protein